MMQSIEKNRLITKLIKIISEKEKIIEKYKRSQKAIEKQGKVSTGAHQMLDQQIQQDINSTHLEVKSIQHKLKHMESRVEQLTQLLDEEVAINATLQQKIQQFSLKQLQNTQQIHTLNGRLKGQQQQKSKLNQELRILKIENAKLSEKIQEYSIQLQYESLLQNKIQSLSRKLTECERFQHKIGDSINRIYHSYCLKQMKQTQLLKTKTLGIKIEEFTHKLQQIEQSLKQSVIFYDGDVLNQSIDGISLIMKSFEQKLQEVAYLTQRRNYQESSQCKHTNARTKVSKEDSEQLRALQSNKQNKHNMNGSI